ncbi:DUF2399 domain-containing protein [Actinoplanes sp. L3-i22]|uniref:DUF2399 domain-containing protein n=1 Tax=Actinoplanes sp. L3-i22 TaxID=2836373 RepID=UPI001C842988
MVSRWLDGGAGRWTRRRRRRSGGRVRGVSWAAVGVWADNISSQAIGWNLPLHPDHPATAVASAYQAVNEPAVLTIGLLTSSSRPLCAPPTPNTNTVWVVEGISVLAAIAGQRVCAPVLCRSGIPSVAVTHLVKAAVAAGWQVKVSSDFEPGGLRGAIALMRYAGTAATPWRLTAADYAAGQSEGEPFTPRQVPATPWDPELTTAMRKRRRRVSEEGRLQLLLVDLQDS